MRNDAQTLLDILRYHKIEYGREPEKAVSEGALECAKLGSKFLELSSTGDHYSVKKYLRRELMKYRGKTTSRSIKDIWQNMKNCVNPTSLHGMRCSADADFV